MGDKEAQLYDVAKEAMPAEQRESFLNQKLVDIIQYAYKNAPAIKEKMDRAGVSPGEIRTIKDLEKIPITRKDDFTELQKASPPFGDFLGVPEDKLQRIFISPGPIYEPQDPEEEFEKNAKALYAAGFRRGDRVIITFSFHMVPPGIRVDETLKKLGAVAIPTGVGNTELQVQIMHELKVNGYIGTPSFLMGLIKRAEELGYNFRQDFVLDHAWVTGEMLPPSLRRSFEQDYGISVTQGYGTAELGLLAYECRQKSGMHIPEEAIIEITDPQTGKQLAPGEIGETVVTPFNKIYPLIRFGTGDLSSITTEPCPCGRTSYRLTGILGRAGEETKVRGMFIHPRQVQEVTAKFDQISNFQVVITRKGQRDEMTINLELKDEAIDKQKLTSELAKTYQDVCRVRADKIQFVAKGTIPKERRIILDERTWE